MRFLAIVHTRHDRIKTEPAAQAADVEVVFHGETCRHQSRSAQAGLRDPRLCVLLAGEGPEATALRALADELQLGSAVQFLGRRNDAGDLLAACDLFVLPSRAEGLGVAALEALGAARPVIASKVGGLADLIVHERCGLHVPPEDPAALAAAIARLRDDTALRERLAAAGPARVDEGFRVGQYVERHLAVYARVLAGAAR